MLWNGLDGSKEKIFGRLGALANKVEDFNPPFKGSSLKAGEGGDVVVTILDAKEGGQAKEGKNPTW